MRHKKTAIDKIVSLAEREGLSYGQYVAREYASHTQRKRHVLDVCKPQGMSTIQATLRVDCPRQCEPVPKPVNSRPHTGGRKVEMPVDEAVELYESGKSVAEIMKRLGATRQNIEGRLRRAGVEMRKSGRQSLSNEKITKIRALRAEGRTYRDIAIECYVDETTVKKYLKAT
ncbi:MAG: hypothetical protein NC299_12930 [Lachnospiraceae bacterium]|nr:hypothetical protein [Ruminococcus sp.]MCM1276242.1 hypothetical protein [Lachnospiraceae bacterium]